MLGGLDLPFHRRIVLQQPIAVSDLVIQWHVPRPFTRRLVHAVDSDRKNTRRTRDLNDRVHQSLVG